MGPVLQAPTKSLLSVKGNLNLMIRVGSRGERRMREKHIDGLERETAARIGKAKNSRVYFY